jgi:hypothetical protein
LEEALHRYTHLGSVICLESGQHCKQIPSGTATEMFFKLVAFDPHETFNNHRTALYEARLLTALAAVRTGSEVVVETPSASVLATGSRDDDLRREPVESQIRNHLGETLMATSGTGAAVARK